MLALKKVINSFFDNSTVTHFENYIIPSLDIWLNPPKPVEKKENNVGVVKKVVEEEMKVE